MKINNKQDEKTFLKKVCSFRFKYDRPLGDTLIKAHMEKTSIILNKSIIVKVSVLDLSKLYIYYFWYRYVKK